MRRALTAAALIGMAALLPDHGTWQQSEYVMKMRQHALPKARSGALEYTRNCGWIDWGHANPTGPKALYEQVHSEKGETVERGYYDVTYHQQMEKEIAGAVTVVGYEGLYRIRHGLSRSEKTKVAYAIFEDISDRFEEFQGNGPHSLISEHSSYAEEDMTSNLLAFHRASRGYTKEDIIRMCRPLSSDRKDSRRQSVSLIKRGFYGMRNTSVKPVLRIKGRFPRKLQPPRKPRKDSYHNINYREIYDVRQNGR